MYIYNFVNFLEAYVVIINFEMNWIEKQCMQCKSNNSPAISSKCMLQKKQLVY